MDQDPLISRIASMPDILNNIKELLKLSLPMVVSSLSSTFIGMLSIPILGNYSIEAMAAAAIASSIHIIFTNVFLACFLGFRILGAKALGRNDQQEAQSLFSTMLSSSTLIGVFLCFLQFSLADYILTFYNLEPDVLKLTTNMLKIYAICYPILALNQSLMSAFFISKKTKICMGITIISDIFGISLAFALVYGFLFISPIGPLGFVFAIFFQHLVSVLLLCTALKVDKSAFTFRFSFCLDKFKKIYKISYPSTISMFFDYLASALIFFMMTYCLTVDSLTAGRIAFTISLLFFNIIHSLSTGFFILGARALGNNEERQYINYAKANQIMIFSIAFLVSTPFWFFPNEISAYFTKFEIVQSNLKALFIYVTLSTLLMAVWFNFSVLLRINEKTFQEMLANLISLWLVQIPMAYVFGLYLELGVTGFFLGLLLSDCSYLILNCYFFFKTTFRQYIPKMNQNEGFMNGEI